MPSTGHLYCGIPQETGHSKLLMAIKILPNGMNGMTFRTMDDDFVGRLSNAGNESFIYQDGYM